MNTTRFGVALIAAVVAASALSGCSKVAEIKEGAAGVIHEVVETGTGQVIDTVGGDLFTAEGIDAAYSAISTRVGADPAQVVEVTIVPGVLTIEAIDPNAPTELNQWSYTAGAVGPSRPVDYGDDTEALQQNLFALNEVSTGAVVTAINGAIAASEIQDGEVQSLIIKRNIPFDENVTVFVNVQGERSSKQVRADVTGRIIDVV